MTQFDRVIPDEVMHWLRDAGPLHLLVGNIPRGWNDLTLTNASQETYVFHVLQYEKSDGRRVIDIRLESAAPVDPRQLSLISDVRGAIAAPKVWYEGLPVPNKCEHRSREGLGPAHCKHMKNLVWCQTVGGTMLTLCTFHANRGKREKWVRDIASRVRA